MKGLRKFDPADRHRRIPEALEGEHRVEALLYSPVVLLDEVVQVFTRPNLRLRAQHSILLEFRDSSVSSRVAVERDRFGRAVLFNCSGKEPFGCGNVSVLAQQEIDRESLLIDNAIEMSIAHALCCRFRPHAMKCRPNGHSVSRASRTPGHSIEPLLNSRMRDIHAALGHQLYQVTVAKFVGDIPTDAENDDCAIKVATAKQGRCVRRRLIHATDYQPNSAFAPEPPVVTKTAF